MTRWLGPGLPEPLLAALADDPGDHVGLTFLLLTATDDGWPHLAMLGAGELWALSPGELRLALWPSSTATANLERGGRATVAAVLDGTSYSVRVRATRAADIEALACFHARVEDVGADVVPYAVLESGVRFSLTDPGATIARWRRVRDALRGWAR